MRAVLTISIVTALAIAWVPTEAGATLILADLRDDYVVGTSDGDPATLSATGSGTWQYLSSDTENPALDGDGNTLLLWDSAANLGSYSDPNDPFNVPTVHINDAVFPETLASNEVAVHPSARNPKYAVVRWTAGPGEDGTVAVSGLARSLDTGSGDGRSFAIFADGSPLLASTLIIPSNTAGIAFNETVTVGVGSVIEFVIGPGSGEAFDSTGLSATMQQIPEPSSVLIWSVIALAFVGARVWRRRRAFAA